MKNKYFGTDGIRGTVNQGNITGEKFFKFGLASGTYFKNQKKSKQIAIIAKDTRFQRLYITCKEHLTLCKKILSIKMFC